MSDENILPGDLDVDALAFSHMVPSSIFYLCICICVFVYLCICVFVFVYLYLCICNWLKSKEA